MKIVDPIVSNLFMTGAEMKYNTGHFKVFIIIFSSDSPLVRSF